MLLIPRPVRRPPFDHHLPDLVPPQQLLNILPIPHRRRHLHEADHQILQHLALNPVDRMKPPPILLLSPPFPTAGHHDDGELRMRKRWPSLVEQVIDAELDAGADDPAEGAEMVVGDVG